MTIGDLFATGYKALGIHRMMSYASLICVAAGLILIVAIKFYFQRDYDRVH